MMGAAAACRPEEPLELHWDEVCVLSTTRAEPATLACYEPKRRDLNLNPRRFRLTYVGVCPMAALSVSQSLCAPLDLRELWNQGIE